VEAVTRASQKLGINRSALIQMLLKKGLNDFRKEGWL
jgi:DNA-binding protein Fis